MKTTMEKAREMATQILRHCLVFLLMLSAVACSKNLFYETAKKDDPEALLFDAERALNAREYTQAIDIFENLPVDFLARRDVNFLRASAYAGRCGLEILDLALELQNLSGGQFLKFLMQIFSASTESKSLDCMGAEELLMNVGTVAADRTVDENLILSFISLAKMGSILNTFADQDDDGEPDAGWDHCDNVDYPEAYVREMGTGIATLLESLQAAGSDIAGGTLDTLSDVCDQDPSLAVICSKTDPSSFDANEVRALRAFTASQYLTTIPQNVNGIGVGACNDMVTDCVCL